MRFTAEKIKEALLHADQDVRTAAAYYFSGSFSADPDIMGRAVQAVESLGWQEAFYAYAFMADLVQTPGSVRWLLNELARQAKPEGEEQVRYVDHLSAALQNAAVELLRLHEAEIMGAEHLDNDLKEAVNERLLFSDLDAESLWCELEHLLTQNDDGDLDPDEYECGCRLVEALARHPKEVNGQVLSILTLVDCLLLEHRRLGLHWHPRLWDSVRSK